MNAARHQRNAMRRPATRGFTLIELMITLVLVAIMSTLAAPSFRTMIAKQKLSSAAAALTESLWLARSEALKRNCDVSFTFTSASAGWDVVPGATCAPATPATLHRQEGFPALTSGSSGGTATTFSFNNYGRLSGTGWVELNSTSAGVVRCVTVSTSGRATVKETACP